MRKPYLFLGISLCLGLAACDLPVFLNPQREDKGQATLEVKAVPNQTYRVINFNTGSLVAKQVVLQLYGTNIAVNSSLCKPLGNEIVCNLGDKPAKTTISLFNRNVAAVKAMYKREDGFNYTLTSFYEK